jgi:HD-GYP domain-containing protein (c-di-GMP phosphodiesterase class II)
VTQTSPPRAGAPYGAGTEEAAGDAYLRRVGRTFILAVYSAVRAIKLYPVENAVVQKSLEDLAAVGNEIVGREGELEFRASGEFIFINATRLRLDLENYASFSHLLALFRASGVGGITVAAGAAPRDWLVLLSLLQAPGAEDPATRREQLVAKLAGASVAVFELSAPSETEDDPEVREQAKEAAKRTYSESIAATREVINSVRLGRSPNLKKIKRAVQGIVDQILNDQTSLLGLTTIRDYDEYTFTHSVNVCIFSVALGRRVGLSKLQLYELGLAALFHDVGKSRVPVEVLQKSGALSDADWRAIASHPWLGVLALFQMRGQQELPYRAMVVAYEHHMKRDLTGYPRPVRERALSIFSKIVAVADGFDAATTRRVYQTTPLSPADVLAEMRDNANRGMDPVVVKSFINLTGIYPVGTLVVLDTFELGLVHAVNPSPEALSRPIVRVVSDDRGNVIYPGDLVDLAARDDGGNFLRTIIKTANPDHYGIRVSDYFV